MSKHILSIDQFKEEEIFDLFFDTDRMRSKWNRYTSLDGKVIGLIFLEPSTRTMNSFMAAIKRLGGDTIAWSGGRNTSMEKGESLEDTIKTMSQYVDAIILRHHKKGAAKRAAAVSDVPIINAGDGGNEHPTQALLDLYTIADERCTDKNLPGTTIRRLSHKNIDGATVLFFGDNKYARAVHSLKKLLGLFDVNILEEDLYFDQETFTGLGNEDVVEQKWDKENYVINLGQADVVYITRLQKERWPNGWFDLTNTFSGKHYAKYRHISKGICFDEADLKRMHKDAIILHPLPRTDEMDSAVDADKRCKIWKQAKNGMFLRMALLRSLFS